MGRFTASMVRKKLDGSPRVPQYRDQGRDVNDRELRSLGRIELTKWVKAKVELTKCQVAFGHKLSLFCNNTLMQNVWSVIGQRGQSFGHAGCIRIDRE